MIEGLILYLSFQWAVAAFILHRLDNPLAEIVKELNQWHK
jgi:hypothetical protein